MIGALIDFIVSLLYMHFPPFRTFLERQKKKEKKVAVFGLLEEGEVVRVGVVVEALEAEALEVEVQAEGGKCYTCFV